VLGLRDGYLMFGEVSVNFDAKKIGCRAQIMKFKVGSKLFDYRIKRGGGW
jgi:hypothetical protein